MVKVGIYYLNWDNTNKEHLLKGMVIGEVYDFNIDNYRHITTLDCSSLNVDNEDDVDDFLSNMYDAFNLGEQLNNRSMCVGDLIMINNKRYVVKPVGFELVA